jgi:hypothetical protein
MLQPDVEDSFGIGENYYIRLPETSRPPEDLDVLLRLTTVKVDSRTSIFLSGLEHIYQSNLKLSIRIQDKTRPVPAPFNAPLKSAIITGMQRMIEDHDTARSHA